MKHWFPAALVGALTLVPLSAAAQTPAPSGAQPSGPSVNLFYIGANTGVAKVERAGGVFGVEAGARVWKNLDLVAEYTWMQDVVTGETLNDAHTVASSLQTTQGKPATGDAKVPSFYFGAGARWVFEQVNLARFKPYVIATIGDAHTEIQSTFTLNGADITGQLPQYGITLGQDLAGTSNNFAIDAGGGVVGAWGAWYVDIGGRLLSMSTTGQQTNVGRFFVGGGYRF
jgi:hypothetical protein